MNRILLAAALCAGGAFSARAWPSLTNWSWPSGDGSYDDASKWPSQTLPVSGTHRAMFDRPTDMYTVAFPADGRADVPFWFRAPNNGGRLTLDFLGRFQVGPADREAFDGEPFKFVCNYVHFVNMEGRQYEWGAASNVVAILDRAKIDTWADPECAHWEMSRGFLQFPSTPVDNNGTPGFTHPKLVIGASVPTGFVDVLFTNEVETSFPAVEARMNGNGRIRYLGGYHKVATSFTFPHCNQTENAYRSDLIVAGEKTHLDVKGQFATGTGDGPNYRARVLVSEGGTLSVGVLKQSSKRMHTLMQASQRGRMVFSQADGWEFDSTDDSTLNVNAIDGGILCFTNDCQFGRTDKIAANGGAFLNTTNALVKIGNDGIDPSRGLRMGTDWTPGPQTEIELTGRLYLGGSANVDASVTNFYDLSNATIVSPISQRGCLSIGFRSPAVVVMTNGTAEVNYALQLAEQKNSFAELTLGGTAQMSVAYDGISVGYAGAARLVVTDQACLKANAIRSSRNASAEQDVVIEQRGGTIELSSWLNLADDANAKNKNYLNLFGGRLSSGAIRGWNASKWKGGAATTILQANGGTVMPYAADSDDFLYAFDEAYLGAGGLTVDTPSRRVVVRQDFAEMAGAEGRGRLVLTGAGLKQVVASARNGYAPTGRSTHSYTVCAGGKTVFAAGIDWATHLIVTNNAVASLAEPGNTYANASALTLKGLTLGDAASGTTGVLELDPSDVITVDGPVSFPCGRLRFTGTPGNGTYDVLRVANADVNFPEVERMAWARMILSAGHVDGHAYRYTTAVDAEGVATLTLTVSDAIPLTGETVWKGTTADWQEAANWSAGVPGDLSTAAFTDEAASEVATLEADAILGALTFGRGQAISGAGSIVLTDSGNAQILATSGTSTVGVGLVTQSAVPLTAQAGAKVVLAGPVNGAGFAKRGDGAVGLAVPAAASGGVMLSEGTLSVAAASGAAAALPSRLTFAAADDALVAVKTDTPLTVGDFEFASGQVAKYGAAPLVLETGLDIRKFMNDRVKLIAAVDFSLDETQPLPTSGFGSINVVEGDLTLRGTSENAGFFSDATQMFIGLRTAQGGANPSLTLDNAYLRSSKHVYVGYGIRRSGDRLEQFWTDATVTVTNTAYLALDTMHFFNTLAGMNAGTYGREQMTAHLNVVDRSTMVCWYGLEIGNAEGGKTYVRVDDHSWLLAGQQDFTRPSLVIGTVSDIEFDHGSEFGMTASVPQGSKGVARSQPVIPARLRFGGSAYGNVLRFKNGSIFHCGLLEYDATADWATNHLYFADATWDAGTEDFDFVFKNGHRLAFVAEGAGLRLSPSAGKTWTMHSILTGSDVVKGGAGTLVFDRAQYKDKTNGEALENPKTAATLAVTGMLRIEEGAVRIADGAAVAGTAAVAVADGAELDLNGQRVSVTSVAGAGTVRNGALTADRLVYGTDVPTFENIDFGAKAVLVDFGRTAEDPLDEAVAKAGIVVAHYVGAPPAGLKLRAVNTGLERLTASTTCADGNITLTLQRTGSVIVIR